tara:strand:+ start:90 stop:557 length:468 start_codon:yes stop_codon:yes gene_type:complete
MNNKTIKEVLENDSIKITNRKVLIINEDKKTSKLKNQVYLNIINDGLDFLEETYGDYNEEMFNYNNAYYNDLDFNKSVVKEIKKIRKQLKKDSLINLSNSFSCNIVNMSIDYYMDEKENCNKDACMRLQYVIQDIWKIGIADHLIEYIESKNENS